MEVPNHVLLSCKSAKADRKFLQQLELHGSSLCDLEVLTTESYFSRLVANISACKAYRKQHRLAGCPSANWHGIFAGN